MSIRFNFFLILLTSMAMNAGPPYLTDDPEPVDYRHFENYLFIQGASSQGIKSGYLPAIELNYGPLPETQASIQFGEGDQDLPGGSHHQGPGDTVLGVKYRFIHLDDSRFQFALYPQVVAPSGSASAGTGEGHWRFYLPFLFQKDFGAWTTYGGPTWWRNPGTGNLDYWNFGWLLQWNQGEDRSYAVEVNGQGPSLVGGPGSCTFGAGTIQPFSPHFGFVCNVGRVFHGPVGWEAYLGLKNTF